MFPLSFFNSSFSISCVRKKIFFFNLNKIKKHFIKRDFKLFLVNTSFEIPLNQFPELFNFRFKYDEYLWRWSLLCVHYFS